MTFWDNATKSNSQTDSLYQDIYANRHTFRAYSLTDRAVDCSVISNSSSTHYAQRSYLYASPEASGSVTIEAAIAVPIFIFFLTALIWIMNIMYIQLTLQIQLEESARQLSQTAYTAYMAYYTLSDDSNEEDDDEADVNSTDSATDYSTDNNTSGADILKNIGLTALSVSAIQNTFMTNDMKTFLDNSSINKGSSGVSFLSSQIDYDAGIVDLIVTYQANIPFVPDSLCSLKLSNRCYFHLYTGEELSKEQQGNTIYLYYTTYGQVFHTNRYCQYLLNYSRVIPFNEVDFSIYQGCLYCAEDDLDNYQKENPMAYITESGYAYHLSLSCQTFTESVFRVAYSTMPEDKKICSQCLKGK